jgi:hypothetical protein
VAASTRLRVWLQTAVFKRSEAASLRNLLPDGGFRVLRVNINALNTPLLALDRIFECDIASLWALEEAAGSPKGQNQFKCRHAAYYGCKYCEKGGRMKKMYALLLLCLCPFCVYAQSTHLSLGNFSFFLSPKILEDGSITDVGAGLDYADRFRGELRLRNTISSKNEGIAGVADSLNAVNKNIFEVFFLPVEYTFIKTSGSRAWLGGGLYYEYDKLREKGFFNMPELEDLGHERVNAYKNDFAMHIIGPLIDAGADFNAGWLDASLSASIVPLFFLASSQEMSIAPLLDPHRADYTQNTTGSPYFYARLDSAFFKYVNLVLLYDAVQLRYKSIDFDDKLRWITPESTVFTQSLKIEVSLLLPLGGMSFQLGYGYTFDWIRFDAASPSISNRQYLILTVKKAGN